MSDLETLPVRMDRTHRPVGTWLSLVEHSLGVRGVGSSNLPVPTNTFLLEITVRRRASTRSLRRASMLKILARPSFLSRITNLFQNGLGRIPTYRETNGFALRVKDLRCRSACTGPGTAPKELRSSCPGKPIRNQVRNCRCTKPHHVVVFLFTTFEGKPNNLSKVIERC